MSTHQQVHELETHLHEHARKALLNWFLELDCVKYDPDHEFLLSSGASSPYYIDVQTLVAHPTPRRLIAELAVTTLRSCPFRSIGGKVPGSIALATTLSDYLTYQLNHRYPIPVFTIPIPVAAQGVPHHPAGVVVRGYSALIVDDVLTTGRSLLTTIRATRTAGMPVTHALVVVDREEHRAKATIESEGVQVLSLVTLSELCATVKELQVS